MTHAPPSRRSVQLRGRAFKALVLAPEAPLPDWFADLDASLKRSPTLLDGRPLILDIAALGSDPEVLGKLLADLGTRRIRILGIEGAAASLSGTSLLDGLAIPPLLVGGRPATSIDVPTDADPETTSLMIEGSVRSGQSIVHPTGDVTVMGSVASGAEILAGGSIHVYGALRGRAIAGAARNPRARIYCRKFEPELLGIDRLVRTAEDMGTTLRGKPVQIWLDSGSIKMATLD
ncbi:septum site-determining protein MinC [Methylobacterium sp. 77]|uniref:septum site-determining protein MinC n=1 Tax=Methylobacterium sp. 77 TaxID=1101192 RepID=UPI0003611049|nr:septum site-determining protein MinC [Methylobacterium sp. 77]